MLVRFEVRQRIVREYTDWEGETPLLGDDVVLTLDPRTSPARPGHYNEPGTQATFRVLRRLFVRQETVNGLLHILQIEVDPL